MPSSEEIEEKARQIAEDADILRTAIEALQRRGVLPHKRIVQDLMKFKEEWETQAETMIEKSRELAR